jgi:hypothetical protein
MPIPFAEAHSRQASLVAADLGSHPEQGLGDKRLSS